MEIQTEHYLNFSDEIWDNLMLIEESFNKGIGSPEDTSLTLVEQVIEEYCNLLKEISTKEEPEFIELGNIALEILKTSMHLKHLLGRSKNMHLISA